MTTVFRSSATFVCGPFRRSFPERDLALAHRMAVFVVLANLRPVVAAAKPAVDFDAETPFVEAHLSGGAWTDAVQRGDIDPRPRAAANQTVFVRGRKRSRYHLKARLLKDRLKEPRCEECGLIGWRGRPLSLELHHVNGDGRDNRLDNLVLLCPNCHSQTDNWGGKAKTQTA